MVSILEALHYDYDLALVLSTLNLNHIYINITEVKTKTQSLIRLVPCFMAIMSRRLFTCQMIDLMRSILFTQKLLYSRSQQTCLLHWYTLCPRQSHKSRLVNCRARKLKISTKCWPSRHGVHVFPVCHFLNMLYKVARFAIYLTHTQLYL